MPHTRRHPTLTCEEFGCEEEHRLVTIQCYYADIQPLDQVWDIHDSVWRLVLRVEEDGPYVELDYGTAVMSAEADHLIFRRLREGEV